LNNSIWLSPELCLPYLTYDVFKSESLSNLTSFHILKSDRSSASSLSSTFLYWLHGSGPNVLDQIAHISRILLPLIINNHNFFVVFPFSRPDTMWLDSFYSGDRVESMLIHELIPYVEKKYSNCSPLNINRFIEGYSMGGYGSARLGFKYPSLFQRISLIAPGPVSPNVSDVVFDSIDTNRVLSRVYNSNQSYFRSHSPITIFQSNSRTIKKLVPRIRIFVGERDFVYTSCLRFIFELRLLFSPIEEHILPDVDHALSSYLNRFTSNYLDFFL